MSLDVSLTFPHDSIQVLHQGRKTTEEVLSSSHGLLPDGSLFKLSCVLLMMFICHLMIKTESARLSHYEGLLLPFAMGKYYVGRYF